MRNACRRTLVLVLISALLLAPSLASAERDLRYYGETPETGITGNTEPYASGTLWDYVYAVDLTTLEDGPWLVAIGAPYEPEYVNTLNGPGGAAWHGNWDSCLSHAALEGSALYGRPAVYWQWDGEGEYRPMAGLFHFQSSWSPEMADWAVNNYEPFGGTFSGEGLQWSSNPEPASMALYGLSLLGIGYWRRRKRTA